MNFEEILAILNSSKQIFNPFQCFNHTKEYLSSNMIQETGENKVKTCREFT